MADPQGFLKYPRVDPDYRPVGERIKDWYEVDRPLVEEVLNQQAARCMDCGVPFCHGVGCPLANRIPEFNELVHRGRWREAAENLHSTNNFPEITGRVCPAPCETACTLAINDRPVTIRQIECQIVERAFREGWIRPARASARSGKRVAVVGSGPAGLAAAQQLARAGHEVVVFEKSDRVGGLLRYGIPDFKMEKQILDRRLDQLRAEGVKFETDITVGVDLSARYLQKSFDAICLSMGAGRPRLLDVPVQEKGTGPICPSGPEGASHKSDLSPFLLDGVHLAMDFLTQQNRRGAGDPEEVIGEPILSASGKNVVVIGGGDTGSDCVGTAIRQGALSVTQLEILPQPPEGSNPETPWPNWPKIMRSSSSQEEGCQRRWSVLTKSFSGTSGHLTELHACEVNWVRTDDGWQMKERPGTDFTLTTDMILLAMGFLHVEHSGLVNAMGLALDDRGNVAAGDHMTSVEGVFAAGDAVCGASLVVHAIRCGREAAAAIDRWLKT